MGVEGFDSSVAIFGDELWPTQCGQTFLLQRIRFLKFFKIYQRNKLGWVSHHSLESIFEILVKNDFKSIKFFPRSRQHNEEAVFLAYK